MTTTRVAPPTPPSDTSPPQPSAPGPNPRTARAPVFAAVALTIALAALYGRTLFPGVGKGDSAELQYMCPLLGICHPPGYAIEVVAGKLISCLPIGPGVAWRINFMQMLCGIAGALAVFGIVRRLTRRTWPGLVAAGLLALSATYWSKSVLADVYVFHAMFLALGLYAFVRFVQDRHAGWFYLAAFLLGVTVTQRPAELFVLPAAGLLWLAHRREGRTGWKRLALGVLLALLPLLFSVGYYLARENPALLHARDDAFRDAILGKGPAFSELPLSLRVREALRYCLGLKAAGREDFTAFSWSQLRWDLNKYAWRLSGLGGLHDRYSPEQVARDDDIRFRQRQQGHGTGIGLLGLALVLAGLACWWRYRDGVLLGAGLFAGNLAYYLYMHPVDNLDFVIPGLMGMSILAGLGVARLAAIRRRWLARTLQGACVAAPLFLAITNYRYMDPRNDADQTHLQLCRLVAVTPLPQNPVIIATYTRAHVLRYVYWVEAGRTNVRVLIYRERFEPTAAYQQIIALRKQGYSVLISSEGIKSERKRRIFASWSPRELVDIGIYWAYPRLRRPVPIHR